MRGCLMVLVYGFLVVYIITRMVLSTLDQVTLVLIVAACPLLIYLIRGKLQHLKWFSPGIWSCLLIILVLSVLPSQQLPTYEPVAETSPAPASEAPEAAFVPDAERCASDMQYSTDHNDACMQVEIQEKRKLYNVLPRPFEYLKGSIELAAQDYHTSVQDMDVPQIEGTVTKKREMLVIQDDGSQIEMRTTAFEGAMNLPEAVTYIRWKFGECDLAVPSTPADIRGRKHFYQQSFSDVGLDQKTLAQQGFKVQVMEKMLPVSLTYRLHHPAKDPHDAYPIDIEAGCNGDYYIEVSD
jgi:hypothetical protein